MTSGIRCTHVYRDGTEGPTFHYLTNGILIHVNSRLNKDGYTRDDRNAFYYKHKDRPAGVLIEYPCGIKRFISNTWYE